MDLPLVLQWVTSAENKVMNEKTPENSKALLQKCKGLLQCPHQEYKQNTVINFDTDLSHYIMSIRVYTFILKTTLNQNPL